ncbi:TPA: hypothetical protein DDZ86_03200 [Candidatus Dependentiae bacterium]|nr:MAG: hypothetical protein UW09_C0001G0008 [candidate division TM6 bacterium GW2011_GWF2_43_87]HBL98623.1 hypothetical protein [Candidatus Dependentiae bacterium]
MKSIKVLAFLFVLLNSCTFQMHAQYVLHGRVGHGRIEAVKKYLEEDCLDIDELNLDGNAAIHIACKSGNLRMVKLLVENDADIDVKTFCSENSPLHIACKNGAIDIVKFLLYSGAAFCNKNKKKKTPMGIACEKGNLDIVKLLFQAGVDPNTRFKSGVLLLYAAYKNSTSESEMIKLLTHYYPDLRDRQAFLRLACQRGHLKIVGFLIENGAERDDYTHLSSKQWEMLLTSLLPLKGKVLVGPEYRSDLEFIKRVIATYAELLTMYPRKIALLPVSDSYPKVLFALLEQFIEVYFEKFSSYINVRDKLTNEQRTICLEFFNKTPYDVVQRRFRGFYHLTKRQDTYIQKLFKYLMAACNRDKTVAILPSYKKLSDIKIMFKK